MGTWSRSLYGNDTTSDVRDSYRSLLQEGMNDKEASNKIISEFSEEPDELDWLLCWVALADTQWSLGRLEPDVKEKALEAIDIYISKISVDTYAYSEEIIVDLNTLRRVKEQLLSSSKPYAHIPKKRVVDYSGNIGDMYAYKLRSIKAAEIGLQDEYYIFHTVDKLSWLGNQYPIAYVYLTRKGEIPSRVEDIINLPMMITEIPPTKTEPISKKEFTKWGDYIYRAALMYRSKTEIKRELVFLGNISKFSIPQNEYIWGDIVNTRQIRIKDIELSLSYPWLLEYLHKTLLLK